MEASIRYVGGKSRFARRIVETIASLSPDSSTVHEPFMGGASVTEHLVGRFATVRSSDACPDVAALWNAVLSGWHPPDEISEDEYAALRLADPSPLRALAGFGASFGGKWFGGYARGCDAKGRKRNFVAESARSIERIGSALRAAGATVACCDYRDIEYSAGDVIYCDPPYSGTLGYPGAGVPFDSQGFWTWAETAAIAGACVYVSEYTAPDGWHSVLDYGARQSVSSIANRDVRTEHLFTR